MDLFASRAPRSERANEIKAQVAAQLGLEENVTVMVSELTCLEEGCPPVETIIAIFDPSGKRLQFKIHRSVQEITAHDIQQICEKQIHPSSETNHGNCGG